MNAELSKHLGLIQNRLEDEDILGFKIGITKDLNTRFKDYKTEGYTHISKIATGCPNEIKQAEQDLIAWANELFSKCDNKSKGGEGQIEDATILYIVAREKYENEQDALFNDVIPFIELFKDSFPIKL